MACSQGCNKNYMLPYSFSHALQFVQPELLALVIQPIHHHLQLINNGHVTGCTFMTFYMCPGLHTCSFPSDSHFTATSCFSGMDVKYTGIICSTVLKYCRYLSAVSDLTGEVQNISAVGRVKKAFVKLCKSSMTETQSSYLQMTF